MSDVLERLKSWSLEMDKLIPFFSARDIYIFGLANEAACEIRSLRAELATTEERVRELELPGELWPASLVQKKIDSVRDEVEREDILDTCGACRAAQGELPERTNNARWLHPAGHPIVGCRAEIIWERRYQRTQPKEPPNADTES